MQAPSRGFTIILLLALLPWFAAPPAAGHVCVAAFGSDETVTVGPPPTIGNEGCTECTYGAEHVHAQIFTNAGTVRCSTSPSPDICTSQWTHTYGAGLFFAARVEALASDDPLGGVVRVWDTNGVDCNGDGIMGDFDGDYDAGVGGGAFGYGAWVNDPECAFGLNSHGPNVVVVDVVFGNAIVFFVGENDQSGPTKIQDPVTSQWTCLTDGTIAPCVDNDPAQCEPGQDADDCRSGEFTGRGATCGTGGGDGLYWVFLANAGYLGPAQTGLSNFPTAGTITAY